MSEQAEVHDLEITPVPPQDITSVKDSLIAQLHKALRESGKEQLLADNHLKLELQENFPVDPVTILVVTLLTHEAAKTYEELILPLLKRHFGVTEHPHQGSED